MKKKTRSIALISSKPLILLIALLGICLGLIFCIFPSDNKPIEREEAVAYSGEFESYEVWNNYREIHFRDGSVYDVYPHTESSEFREKMESLDEGTKLAILVNPNNGYVAEIKTESEELLNFERSQQAIDDYDNGYFVIGVSACVLGASLLLYVIIQTICERKEKARQALTADRIGKETDTMPLRYADPSVKCRILLEAQTEGYRIGYRRVKTVNELVVNGRVYDEKKALLEFEHSLVAYLDGHKIEAGLDASSYSYIMFDGALLARKARII